MKSSQISGCKVITILLITLIEATAHGEHDLLENWLLGVGRKVRNCDDGDEVDEDLPVLPGRRVFFFFFFFPSLLFLSLFSLFISIPTTKIPNDHVLQRQKLQTTTLCS